MSLSDPPSGPNSADTPVRQPSDCGLDPFAVIWTSWIIFFGASLHQLITGGKAMLLPSGYRFRRIMSLSSPPPGPNSANMPIQQLPADESPSVAEIWKSWLLSGTDQHHRGLTKRQCFCHSATDFNGYGYLIAFLLPAQTTSTHQFASPLESEDPSVKCWLFYFFFTSSRLVCSILMSWRNWMMWIPNYKTSVRTFLVRLKVDWFQLRP